MSDSEQQYATDTAKVLEKISDDNSFKHIVAQLRVEYDYSWEEVWDELERVYNPVDRAAFEETTQ